MFDGGGLYLFVSAKGAKTWRMAYRVGGKQKTISFGAYPEVSLAEARAKRDEARAAVRESIDPMCVRRAARHVVTLADASTSYWSGRHDLSDSYRKNATRGIEMHLLPTLGAKAIGDISRDDLLAELRRMDAAGLHVYVRKVRAWVGQVFDWAVEHGHSQTNPAASIRSEKAFGRAVVEHFAALDARDVPAFMRRLAVEDQDMQSVLACRMLAYTWVRTNELRMMQWGEINTDDAVWIIPAGKMKRRREHVVPLSRQALAIIETMRARARVGQAYVFPNERRSLDRPMSENAVLYLIARIGYKGRMTGHGWRSVASTWANEAGYNADAIERQLAHVPDNKVRSIYNRAEYLPERRVMLQDWSDWLDSHNQVDTSSAKG